MASCSYFVTGANSGCGLEAARQLAVHFSQQQQETSAITTIYLLCRSEEKALAAIETINKSVRSVNGKTNTENLRLEFLKFDACDDEETICKNMTLPPGNDNSPTIGGILLNAGGFGDGKEITPPEPNTSSGRRTACEIAKLNITGHVILVRHLLATQKTDASTRIIAVGSESAIVTPLDRSKANFVAHLEGTVPLEDKIFSFDYAWTKRILALYWAAFARHHPDFYVVTVSPGAVPSTQILNRGSVSLLIKAAAYIHQLQIFGGSHSVEAGAKRYIDALLGHGLFEQGRDTGESKDENQNAGPPESGSFLASREGFTRDFGDVRCVKNGEFICDRELQDRAWAAVQEFV